MSKIEVSLIHGATYAISTVEREGTEDTALDVAIGVLGEVNNNGKGPYLIEDIKVDGSRLGVPE